MSNTLRKKILSNGDLPKHIAIIMDGNGRWATSQHLPRLAGHKEGINSVREIVRVCGEIGIEYLTLYTFSSENWNRPKLEVKALMNLLDVVINEELDNLIKQNIKFRCIGNIKSLPNKTKKSLIHTLEKTSTNDGLNLILAINYSGRWDIINAVRKIIQKFNNDDFANFNEKIFDNYLSFKEY